VSDNNLWAEDGEFWMWPFRALAVKMGFSFFSFHLSFFLNWTSPFIANHLTHSVLIYSIPTTNKRTRRFSRPHVGGAKDPDRPELSGISQGAQSFILSPRQQPRKKRLRGRGPPTPSSPPLSPHVPGSLRSQ